MNKGFCIICGKMILIGEPTMFTKPKGYRTKWFHTSCWRNIRQKFEESPKEIETKES